MEQNVEFDYYGRSMDQRARADDFIIKSMEDRYPRKQSIPYSKPGGKIASYKVFFCSNLVEMDANCQHIETSGENDELFARISFLKDVNLDESNTDIKSLFYVVTQNRIGSGKNCPI